MSIHNRVSGYVKIYLLELGVVHPTPLPFPVPIPKQERKRAQHKHTGHCSWFVTTTNWRLDRRSWRPSFRSRLPSTKGVLPHRAVYSAGPTQVILVVSTFSFNRLGVLLVLALKVTTGCKSFFWKRPLALSWKKKRNRLSGWSPHSLTTITNYKLNDYRTWAKRTEKLPHQHDHHNVL